MRLLLRGVTALSLSLLALACSATDAPAKYTSGEQYSRVREMQAPADPKRIEVAEFFWYGCPHCYAFDPVLRDWIKTKPADVDFVRIPNSLGHAVGELHAKAYYTAKDLNVLDQMHSVLFDAIHKERIPLNTEAQIQYEFNKTTGILPDVFDSTFKGFTVDSQVRRAQQLAKSYGVTSVPTLVIGGKYETSPAMAGSLEETTKVIDFLVDKVRKERAAK